MWVTDLKGFKRKWRFKSGIARLSTGHKLAKILLADIFPVRVIYEEVTLPGTKLSIDFWIPSLPLAVEVQGEQHDKYIPHFHQTRENFVKQIARDIKKKEWLKLNNIPLVELRDKHYDQWRESIVSSFQVN